MAQNLLLRPTWGSLRHPRSMSEMLKLIVHMDCYRFAHPEGIGN
jgi:hypothetical protein